MSEICTQHPSISRLDDCLREQESYVKEKLGNKIKGSVIAFGELTLEVEREEIQSILLFLREDSSCSYVSLIDISGVDYPSEIERFSIVYHLLSPIKNSRIRVKLKAADGVAVPSICSVYAGAEWYEREIYDMFGVLFLEHPDLRRILTDYGFQGHPLRKDFPTSGFVECRYDEERKRIIHEPVVLRQEMRNFDFLSPWAAIPKGMVEIVPEEGGEDA